MPSAERRRSPPVAVADRHGEQRAYGVNVVDALEPIVTVQVPPAPGVLGKLL
ncbi:MAG: hypothetical protein JO286_11625 [Solirubrobacterales bacterium]|nr:hypothetical protein [Solirubrobacterales bacterium]MBV9807827.1 hypothetical protein [Solirubrobacterales bacterium]